MDTYSFKPIGVISSPHKNTEETPIQPVFAKDIRGTVRVFDEYVPGLLDLDGFSHLFLFYVFNQSHETKLQLCPYLQDTPHGIFATRAPCRPNKIGFSIVRLLSIEGSVLHLADVDILDGTPLLDIKPFVERFDLRDNVRSGWQEEVDDLAAKKRGLRGYENRQDGE